MISKEAAKRLSVMLLALVMTLSITGYSFVEAFAEDREDPAATEESLDKETVEGTGSTEIDAPEGTTVEGEVETETSGDATQGEKEAAEPIEPAEEQLEKPKESAGNGEELEEVTEETPKEEMSSPAMYAAKLAPITVRASKDEYFVSVFWTKVSNAAYYMVYLNDSTAGVKVAATENKYIFNTGNPNLAVRTVKVEAYCVTTTTDSTATDNAETSGNDQPSEKPATSVPSYEKFAEGSTADINVINRRKLSSNNTQASFLGLSLRDMIGERHDGYSVTQGAATDGRCAYFMMTSSSNQKGRILKVDLTNTGNYVAGPVIDIHHANGMTYDSKRRQLVAVGYGAWRQQLSFIDPNSLTLVSQQDITYPYNIDGVDNDAKQNGIAAIAYIPKYNVYVARSRGRDNGVGNSFFNNDLWVINADNLSVIGHIFVHVTGRYPETYQSMDADEKYVYYLLSPGSGQGNNIILCLDWDSENLLPVLKGEKKYVEYTWKVNNNDSGDPDAVMTIPIAQESEGLFHTNDANGNSHFYVSEYYGRWHYKTVTKNVTYKKKWKKVRKWYNKKTKKWTTKKPKKKYRGKSKKVWKYKTKTKKKNVTVKDYWARDDYVYYIGSF